MCELEILRCLKGLSYENVASSHLVQACEQQGHEAGVRCGDGHRHLRQGERECVEPQHLHRRNTLRNMLGETR